MKSWIILFAILATPALAQEQNCWEQIQVPCPSPEEGISCWTQIKVRCPEVIPVGEIIEKMESEQPKEHPVLRIAAGGLASLGGGTENAVEPMAFVGVTAPLFDHPQRMATRFEVDAYLTALPGESLEITDVKTFRALEFAGRICQPLTQRLYFTPCVEAGFATRLAGESEPRFRAARWFALTMKVRSQSGDYTSAGISADERIDSGGRAGPYYRPAALISGSVQLIDTNQSFGHVSLMLVGRAILHLRVGSEIYRESPPDKVVLGIMVAR